MSKRLSLWIGSLFLLASPSFGHDVVRYDNGRWWNGSTFEERTFFTEEGRLRSATDRPADATVDLEGGFVIPPLADAHNHALGGPGFEEQRDALLGQGVFYLANPNNVARLTEAVRSQVNRPGSLDVLYANGGLTSSGGHPAQIYERMLAPLPDWTTDDLDGQAYFAIDDAQELERRWPEILAGRPDFLKVYLEVSEEHGTRKSDPEFHGRRGLDPALLPEVVRRAHDSGLRVHVHVSSAADVRAAVEAGADAIAHLPLERLDEDLIQEAVRGGVVFVSTLTSHRPTAHVADLDDVQRHNLALLRRHGAPLVLGTDSGRGILDEMRELQRLGGYTAAEVLNLATRATPRFLFPERSLGTLEEGAEASFLVLEGDPTTDLGALATIRRRVQKGHELQLAPPAEKPSIAQHLVMPLMHEGFATAEALYRRLRAEEPDAWDFSEGQLDALGHKLLELGRTELAVPVFALNAEIFPDSANAYDSWGEGLIKAGRNEEAIAKYRRSLELEPSNQKAREKLRELARDEVKR